MDATPGVTREAILSDAPPDIIGTLTFEVRTEDGSVVQAPRSTGITGIAVTDQSWIYRTPFTTPVSPGDYLIVWRFGDRTGTEDLVVSALTPTYGNAPAGVGYSRLLFQTMHLLQRPTLASVDYVDGTPVYTGPGRGFVDEGTFPCRLDWQSGGERLEPVSDARAYTRKAKVFALDEAEGGPPVRREDRVIVEGIEGIFEVTFPRRLPGFAGLHHLEIEVVTSRGT